MPTLSEVTSLLSRYAGSGNTFNDRLNLVRARLLQGANVPGSKQQILLDVFSDRDGNSIVTLPRGFKTVLEGAVRSTNVLCAGQAIGVLNEHSEFNVDGLGYGGISNNFILVNGRYSVFQEWSSPMRIRFKFEVSESAGTIYISGTLAGEDVYALNTATWEKREAVAFTGTATVTSLKYFDAQGFKIKKPVTNGRVSVYVVDDNGVETLVGVYEPSETLPRWKRYKVPNVQDVAATESTFEIVPSQFYSKSELDAMFADSGTISVSAAGTHDLVYAAFFLRTVKVSAAAGSGAYVHTFTLDNSTVKTGGIFRVRLEIAQSANPVIKFYDNTLSGTLLQTINGDAGAAIYETEVFEYDGSAWHWTGREL